MQMTCFVLENTCVGMRVNFLWCILFSVSEDCRVTSDCSHVRCPERDYVLICDHTICSCVQSNYFLFCHFTLIQNTFLFCCLKCLKLITVFYFFTFKTWWSFLLYIIIMIIIMCCCCCRVWLSTFSIWKNDIMLDGVYYHTCESS